MHLFPFADLIPQRLSYTLPFRNCKCCLHRGDKATITGPILTAYFNSLCKAALSYCNPLLERICWRSFTTACSSLDSECLISSPAAHLIRVRFPKFCRYLTVVQHRGSADVDRLSAPSFSSACQTHPYESPTRGSLFRRHL